MDSDSESKLISLISQLYDDESLNKMVYTEWKTKVMKVILKTISFVVSMKLESQPKPESKLMSLVTEAINLFHSTDLGSLPKGLSDLISCIAEVISQEKMRFRRLQFGDLVSNIVGLEPEPELVSLIRQMVYTVSYMDPIRPLAISSQEEVSLIGGKFHLGKVDFYWSEHRLWNCFFGMSLKSTFRGGNGVTYLAYNCCKGKHHDEYEKVPHEIKHPLHPKHSLRLVWLEGGSKTRECYCCCEELLRAFYYCSACDFAMNIACAEKTPLLSRDHPKWHEHELALFPSMASLPCNLCALTHSSCPFYICPPCDFVAHQTCLSLPRTIRICRHPHRISFTRSFDQGELLSCGVCRRKIDNDYGGYSCIKDDCEYAVHSRCATQENVWDGIDLEGTPEEIEEEEVEPFVRIADGIIQHFSHRHHNLRLDENKCKDYDKEKLCQACITPIYFGNFYTCEQCEFILHEKCANFALKIYHPTHPHKLRLALVGEKDFHIMDPKKKCSVCSGYVASCLVYECSEEECNFQIDIPCTILSEPLAHESHKRHLLFLTSKPGETKECSLCSSVGGETFNCIECDDFSLCFECAAVPIKVRYKHDSHTLTLCHEEDKRTLEYWCEVCEEQIMDKRFYMCDENCCVTLHIECLAGVDLRLKPNSSIFIQSQEVRVLPNNHTMSRPLCFRCKRRCPQKIAFQLSVSIFCCINCVFWDIMSSSDSE